MESYIGPLAGLATSALWTATSLFFSAAARRLGVTVLNALRISMAILLLATTHRLFNGFWIPSASATQVFYLAFSGLVGLTIGDQALFTAFVHIGPRRAMLIMTTSPLWAALFGWLAMDETLGIGSSLGIAMTVLGVAWVVRERQSNDTKNQKNVHMRGYVLALLAAACQAGGLMLSKKGMGHGLLPADEIMAPQTATLIRMVFAGCGMAPLVLLRSYRKRGDQGCTQADRPSSFYAGVAFAFGGAVVGPFLGVWMSLVAADRAPVGVAQSLCSLAPIFILPFAVWIHKERISARAVMGAVIAVSGTFVLFLLSGS